MRTSHAKLKNRPNPIRGYPKKLQPDQKLVVKVTWVSYFYMLLICTLISIGLFYWSGSFRAEDEAFAQHGVAAQARVIDYSRSKSNSSKSDRYYLTYRYEVNGANYTNQAEVTQNAYGIYSRYARANDTKAEVAPEYKLGGSKTPALDIRYLSDNPAKSELIGRASYKRGAEGLTTIGFIFAAFSIIMLLGMIKKIIKP